MSFFTSHTAITNYIFKGLDIKGTGAIVGTCAVVFVVTFILEGMKSLMLYWTARLQQNPLTYGQTDSTNMDRHPLFSSLVIPSSLEQIKRRRLKYHCLSFLTHTVNVIISYFIMLSVMSYNVWIALGVLLGSGVGYYIFGAQSHKIQEKYANLSAADQDDHTYQINSAAEQEVHHEL